jgi:NDP-sugar pyrophosphorylase family protein
MKKPTLLILAAGMASRYGSMKQTEGFGPCGETIMEYSIYDAIKAGFGKVVFIIRKDFAAGFKERFGNALQPHIEVEYVFQELDSFVEDQKLLEGRTKPWGTGHAILCASKTIHEPFAVINADDYYAPDAFIQAANFLRQQCDDRNYSIIGYQLDKTLSDHGTVSRGVCAVNASGHLIDITERTKIYKTDDKVFFEEEGKLIQVDGASSVSMNFWCFHPSFFEQAAELFKAFLLEKGTDPKAEFFIPIIADAFIKRENHFIHVIPTTSQWFGVTYKEDAPTVKQQIDDLIKRQVYPSCLWP